MGEGRWNFLRLRTDGHPLGGSKPACWAEAIGGRPSDVLSCLADGLLRLLEYAFHPARQSKDNTKYPKDRRQKQVSVSGLVVYKKMVLVGQSLHKRSVSSQQTERITSVFYLANPILFGHYFN